MTDARTAFEAQANDSMGFRRSRRGTYVNPPVARDWKWFQAGMAHAAIASSAAQSVCSHDDLKLFLKAFETSQQLEHLVDRKLLAKATKRVNNLLESASLPVSAAEPAQETEPVAEVRYANHGGITRGIRYSTITALVDVDKLPIGTKLYAHALMPLTPPQAVQPQGEPSDEQINRIVWEHTRLNPNQAADVDLLLCVRNAVRAVLALRPSPAPAVTGAGQDKAERNVLSGIEARIEKLQANTLDLAALNADCQALFKTYREYRDAFAELNKKPTASASRAVRVPMSDEQAEALTEDLSEWSRHVEVDTAPCTLEKHVRNVLSAHGITQPQGQDGGAK